MKKSDFAYFQNAHIALSSIVFGVTLATFLYVFSAGILSEASHYILFAATFLFMLRFWYRYVTFYGKALPSNNYWHHLLDFAIAFFGNVAVLKVNYYNIWTTAVVVMLAIAIVRSLLAIPSASKDNKKVIKQIVGASVFLAVFFIAVNMLNLSAFISSLIILAVIALFVVWKSVKE